MYPGCSAAASLACAAASGRRSFTSTSIACAAAGPAAAAPPPPLLLLPAAAAAATAAGRCAARRWASWPAPAEAGVEVQVQGWLGHVSDGVQGALAAGSSARSHEAVAGGHTTASEHPHREQRREGCLAGCRRSCLQLRLASLCTHRLELRAGKGVCACESGGWQAAGSGGRQAAAGGRLQGGGGHSRMSPVFSWFSCYPSNSLRQARSTQAGF